MPRSTKPATKKTTAPKKQTPARRVGKAKPAPRSPAARKAPAKPTQLPRAEKVDAASAQPTQLPPAEKVDVAPATRSDRVWTNQEIAQLLHQIGDLLAILGENSFKTIAYHRAADVIENSSRGVQSLWAGELENLRQIPGVGEALSEKLDELFRTGHMSYYDKLAAQVPVELLEFLQIPGVGPKTVARFWHTYNITTLPQLEAALANPQQALKGLGDKTIENLKSGLAAIRRKSTRVRLAAAFWFADEIIEELKAKCGKTLVQVSTAGSLRRMRATIGDLDLVTASDEPQKILDAFTSLPQVREVSQRGDTKASIIAHNGQQVDLRVLEPARWGTALQYFTGSREHNIRVRDIALKQGLSLSEWSFARLKGGQEILCDTEQEVYERLGMDWMPPELREASGEIEAALEHRLPVLIELRDLKGDLQCHSVWSDGQGTIREMAEGARRRGLHYIAITDHSKGLGVARGLDEKRTREQWLEIEALNREFKDFQVLRSVEVEIRADGTLDQPDELLAEYDLVVATTHSALNQSRDKITERVVKALRHPFVDIFGHPTGRLIGTRDESALDLEVVFQVAQETGTVLEIDGTSERMDLDDVHARRAVELGCKIVIDSDAHSPDGFDDLFWGVAMARRGWLTQGDVLNTLEWPDLKKHLKRYRKTKAEG